VEVVALGFDLGAHGAREAELAEDLADLVHDLGDEMQAAPPLRPARHGQVRAGRAVRRALQLALARLERRLELALQGVRRRAHRLAGGRLKLRQRSEKLGERAGFAPEDFGLQVLEPALVRLRNLPQTLPQLGEGCQEVAHGQSARFATSASCPNAAGSRTARSARTLRLTSTPARRRPFIMRL